MTILRRQRRMVRMPSWVRSGVLAIGLLVLASPAYAHDETGAAAGFFSGLHHPVSGVDHVLAMVMVGLWGAQLGAPAIWMLPVTFPLVMAVGAFVGLIGLPLPGVEVGIALSAILLGLMVLAEARPSLWIAAVLVGVFAVFHGHAHGTELGEGQSAITYSIGFVLATGLLHAAGIGIGVMHKWTAGRIAMRAAGAVAAAGGLVFLWRAVA